MPFINVQQLNYNCLTGWACISPVETRNSAVAMHLVVSRLLFMSVIFCLSRKFRHQSWNMNF